jgi:hypothetical protein
MIFGRVMANIRHGGGSRTLAFRPFSEVVRCDVVFVFFWRGDVEEVQKPVPLFLRVPLILGCSGFCYLSTIFSPSSVKKKISDFRDLNQGPKGSRYKMTSHVGRVYGLCRAQLHKV